MSGATGELLQGRNSGLSGAFSTQTFDGLGLASGVAIASTTVGGVTIGFGGAYAGTGYFYFPLSGFAVYNFRNAESANAVVGMTFSAPTRAIAFQFAALASAVTFEAWLDATSVGTFRAFGFDNVSNVCWWGFEFGSQTFNRLTITSEPNQGAVTAAFGFDNLQVPTVSTVPEPSTVGLLAVGLLGLGAAVRRRKKH